MSRRFMASGFTAAEMLVASAIAGIVAGTAALTIYTVTLAQRQYTQIATFTLPNGALANFYPGQSGTSVNCVVAPSFSAVAQAESMREKFIFDISQAVGVYCLARNSGNYNTIRPVGITSPPAGTILDTPDAFRTYLGTLYSAAPTTFAFAGGPLTRRAPGAIELLHHPQHRAPIVRFGHYFHVRLRLQQSAQPLANNLVVVR